METEAPNYRKQFLGSPHHWWLAGVTLGLGFLSAQPLFLMAGVAAYALGWVYAPDLGFFRGWVDRRVAARLEAETQAQVAQFQAKRAALLDSLGQIRRGRYHALSEVCRSIEAASQESPLGQVPGQADPRLRKLDELMWTFLRLLTIEESLERFLETERREDLPGVLKTAEQEVNDLNGEIEAQKARGPGANLEGRQRLLASRQERLEVLRKRLQRIDQAKENLALVLSEEDRLDQQIKLIRADAVASRNADALTARIDATVEHLDQTNRWLAEMDEFKDLIGDLPQTPGRIGFEPQPPPVVVNDRRVGRERVPTPPPLRKP